MAEKKGAGKAKTGAASKAAKAPAALNTVPEWASTTAVAKLLGKTTRRIQQLTQDGVLETEVPPGGGARKYKTCETIQRYIAHIEQKAQETAAASSTAELNLRKLEAEVELKESQGQLHKLKTAIAEGKYIKAEEATRDLADFMAMFKKFAMNIPPRAVKSIAGYADPQTARAMERAMRKELEDMLAVFVDAAEIGPEEAEPCGRTEQSRTRCRRGSTGRSCLCGQRNACRFPNGRRNGGSCPTPTPYRGHSATA